jgi:hypothetical protein
LSRASRTVRYSNLASERPRYFLLPLDLLLNHLLDFDNTSRHHRHSCIELVCLYDQPPPSNDPVDWSTTDLCCKPTVLFLQGDFIIPGPQSGEGHCHNHGILPSPPRPRSIQILTYHLSSILDVRRRQRNCRTEETCGSKHAPLVAETPTKLISADARTLRATSSSDSTFSNAVVVS